jgi:hypothetical protein
MGAFFYVMVVGVPAPTAGCITVDRYARLAA